MVYRWCSIVGTIVRENCSGVGPWHTIQGRDANFPTWWHLRIELDRILAIFDSIEPAFSLSLSLSPSPSLSLSFFLSLYLVSLDSFPSLDFTKSKSVLRRSFSRRRWKMVEYRAKYHVSRDNRRIGKRPSFRRNRPASGPRHTTFTVENPFPPIEFSNAILPATSAQLFSSNSKREACLCLPLVARVVLEGGGYRAPS